jgi:threonine synthase
LGEGNTPLIWTNFQGKRVAVKAEHQNPSGSFKDRGSALIISFLAHRGVRVVLEDSSGNAGASLAAYAARAGMHARIYVPDSASGPKRQQISRYGAEVVRIMGARSNATEAVHKAVETGGGDTAIAYGSHAYLPINLPGYATVAYEIWEQLGASPGSVIVPVGQGGLFLGIARGFHSLYRSGLINHIPLMVGVQVRACAPLWALAAYGPAGLNWAVEGDTVAEGIRVVHPVRGDEIIALVQEKRAILLAVDEEEIFRARTHLARQGFDVEPTSAVAWAALTQPDVLPEPVVVVLTGNGLKSGV